MTSLTSWVLPFRRPGLRDSLALLAYIFFRHLLDRTPPTPNTKLEPDKLEATECITDSVVRLHNMVHPCRHRLHKLLGQSAPPPSRYAAILHRPGLRDSLAVVAYWVQSISVHTAPVLETETTISDRILAVLAVVVFPVVPRFVEPPK